METAIRSSRPKPSISRHSVMICRRHPNHQQSPGVCSVCLNEKLSKISSSSSRTRARPASSSSSSSVSSLSSSSGSSCSSPVHHRHYGVDDRRGFSTTFFKSAKNRSKSVLTKSRSVAVITRRRDDQEHDDEPRKKKVGFWSKLLRPMNSRKKNVDFDADHHHSRTLKQMMIPTRVH